MKGCVMKTQQVHQNSPSTESARFSNVFYGFSMFSMLFLPLVLVFFRSPLGFPLVCLAFSSNLPGICFRLREMAPEALRIGSRVFCSRDVFFVVFCHFFNLCSTIFQVSSRFWGLSSVYKDVLSRSDFALGFVSSPGSGGSADAQAAGQKGFSVLC